MKQIYEIINECKTAGSVDDVLNIIASNHDNNILKQVLYYTYHPKAKWYINEFPKNYKKPDTLVYPFQIYIQKSEDCICFKLDTQQQIH